jgi:hypothetical protein
LLAGDRNLEICNIHQYIRRSSLLEHRQRQGIANRDAAVMIPTWLAFVLPFQGHLDQAVRTCDLSVKEANPSTSLHSRAFGLAFAAGMSRVLQEFEELLVRADALCDLATERNFSYYVLACGLLFRGFAKLHLGSADGAHAASDGLALYRQTGSKWALPFWLGCYANALSQGPKVMALVREGLDAVEATGERWYEAELYRLRGHYARFGPPRDNGRDERDFSDFHTAKRIAAQQGAKLLELRAAMSLARLWGEQGRRAVARDLLARVYGVVHRRPQYCRSERGKGPPGRAQLSRSGRSDWIGDTAADASWLNASD